MQVRLNHAPKIIIMPDFFTLGDLFLVCACVNFKLDLVQSLQLATIHCCHVC